MKRLSLGQQIAPSPRRAAETLSIADSSGTPIGQQSLEATIKEAGESLSRMNRRCPDMKLPRLPEEMRERLGEPDVDVCLQYYLRFIKAKESDGDEPVSILTEFLSEHPIEFQCSGWVCNAFGYLAIAYEEPPVRKSSRD